MTEFGRFGIEVRFSLKCTDIQNCCRFDHPVEAKAALQGVLWLVHNQVNNIQSMSRRTWVPWSWWPRVRKAWRPLHLTQEKNITYLLLIGSWSIQNKYNYTEGIMMMLQLVRLAFINDSRKNQIWCSAAWVEYSHVKTHWDVLPVWVCFFFVLFFLQVITTHGSHFSWKNPSLWVWFSKFPRFWCVFVAKLQEMCTYC